MILQLALAFVLICATVIIHALGTLEAITHLTRKWQKLSGRPGWLRTEMQMTRIVGVLLVLHLVEAAVWAVTYLFAGLLPDLETAFYFSLTSYTTVGYGDVVLPVAWRILGPIEGSVGILMFGWSTGIMVTALSRIYGNWLQATAQLTPE